MNSKSYSVFTIDSCYTSCLHLLNHCSILPLGGFVYERDVINEMLDHVIQYGVAHVVV